MGTGYKRFENITDCGDLRGVKRLISARDLQAGNVCIKEPGLYCVASTASFDANAGAMIRICADDVTLDLGSFTLSGVRPASDTDTLSHVSGILIAAFDEDDTDRCRRRRCACLSSPCAAQRRTLRNIVVRNGALQNFTAAGITAFNVDNVLLENVALNDNGNDNVCDFSTCAQTSELFRFVSGGVALQNCQNVTMRQLLVRRSFGVGLSVRSDNPAFSKRYVIEQCDVSCTQQRTRLCIGRDPDADPCTPQPLSADTELDGLTRAVDVQLSVGTQLDCVDVDDASLGDIVVRDCVLGSAASSVNALASSGAVQIMTEPFNASSIKAVVVERCTVQNIVAPRSAIGMLFGNVHGLLCRQLRFSGLQTTGTDFSVTLSALSVSACRQVVLDDVAVADLSTTSDQGATIMNAIDIVQCSDAQVQNSTVQRFDVRAASQLFAFCTGMTLENCDSATVDNCRVDAILTDQSVGIGILTVNGKNQCVGNCHVSRCDLDGIAQFINRQFLTIAQGVCYVANSTTPGAGQFSSDANAPPSQSSKFYINVQDKSGAELSQLRNITVFNIGPFVDSEPLGPCEPAPPAQGTLLGFVVTQITEQNNVLTYDVTYVPGADNDVPFVEGSAYQFFGVFGDPKPEWTVRDNKIERNVIGVGLEVRTGLQMPADNTAIALYRNEFICNNQTMASAGLTFPFVPLRQWTLGQMPAPPVSGAQLDNLDIECCDSAQQSARSVQNTVDFLQGLQPAKRVQFERHQRNRLLSLWSL